LKLITEEIVETEILTEGEGFAKKLYIQGPFMSADTPNRNNRIYPAHILEAEVARYLKEQVNVGSGWGELQHPTSPQINPERISHRITSLVREGNHYIGKAMIIKENPCGAIVAGLINSGGRIGVSSRGLGSLKPTSSGLNEVQGDFRLSTAADIVLDPSNHASSWVGGILESVEFAITEDGRIVQEETKKRLRKLSLNEISERREAMFTKFISQLTK
jgi:hypothetical protein